MLVRIVSADMSYPLNKFTTQMAQSTTIQKMVLVSIGNPSPKFDNTRHSAGHIAMDYFIESLGGVNTSEKIVKPSVEVYPLLRNNNVFLAKSLEFMNNSGKAVKSLREMFPNDCELIVMHDDLDTKIGSATFKLESRKMGAHNGLASISQLGQPFPRIRLGIGEPSARLPGVVASYVMSKFSLKEKQVLMEQTLPGALDIFNKILHAFDLSTTRRGQRLAKEKARLERQAEERKNRKGYFK